MNNSNKTNSENSLVIRAYERLISDGKITDDQNQRNIAEKLDDLAESLSSKGSQKKGLITKLFSKDEGASNRGIYIYGDVGRGKSLFMDMFFDVVKVKKKRRVHFHAFMMYVHSTIHLWRQKKNKKSADPIPHVAKELANEAWLLCFDEFQVSDITDAMILGRLFEELFKNGAVVVATSNRHPDDLYKDGLQRQRFTPFIDMFKEKLEIVSLDGDTDYRLQHFKGFSTVYFTPLGKEANKFLSDIFVELTNASKPDSCELQLKGRVLNVKKMHGDVAFFTFKELCEEPLGAADYIEVAREFNTILLADIPKLSKEKRNEAKRFVTLIDELYEHKTKLICTAEVGAADLYPKGDGAFEFERTVSRLIEMQSEKYLGLTHVS